MKKRVTKTGYMIDKVQVDLSCHKGVDQYSDGDIEDEILECWRTGKALEVLHNDNRWPIIYHLSPERENLLSWIPFKRTDRILEIGSGCGALSGVLARKGGSLDCVELSPRRAEISAWRNHEHGNMTIHVGNLNDFSFEEKFDYVTLIGVLEYAGAFTHTDNPYKDFIASCQRFLKPGGSMIIAIENRLGMKYWSGAREDHTGAFFDGILNYPSEKRIRTFARKELYELLASSGLDEQYWYYPYPDYKIPIEIHSDNYLPSSVDILHYDNPVFDMDRHELFSEVQALAGICDAGLYPEFSNSFLVLCKKRISDLPGLKLPYYIHYTVRRKQEYDIQTEIWEENGVRVIYKRPKNEKAISHLRVIAENCKILTHQFGSEHVAQAELLADDILKLEYVVGDSFTDLLIRSLQEGGVEALVEYLKFYCDNILKGDNTVDDKNWLPDIKADDRKYNIDITFDNIRIRDGQFVVFDYEWLVPEVNKQFILYRAFIYLYYSYSTIFNEKGVTLELLLGSIGITEDELPKYKKMDDQFYTYVLDNYLTRYQKQRKKVSEVLWTL